MNPCSVVSRRRVAALLAGGLAAPLLARTGRAQSATPAAVNAPPADAPRAIAFPADSGPHDGAATEWWYYTGHLFTDAGDKYGFEYVIFRAVRGDLEGYVSHFAVTDNPAGEFSFAQQIVGAEGVRGETAAMDLTVNGWTMVGEGGDDRLRADMPGYAINLKLEPGKPPALHEGDGYIDYGNGTYSWYYSRTRMPIVGVLRVGEENLRVTGSGWMDHQWGNFTTFEDGGWDWYAVQLDDDTEVMLYVIHDGRGNELIVDGSIVGVDGTLTVLDQGDFRVRATGEWTSPATGTTWPQGWTIGVDSADLRLDITPTMPDQELDTRFTTGIIYWEGQSVVSGTKGGKPVRGNAYVELTGYAPVEQAGALGPSATPVVVE
jgi:predicted secreted hydrolase